MTTLVKAKVVALAVIYHTGNELGQKGIVTVNAIFTDDNWRV